MPPKKKIAPPVDRPLSKAYLRGFSGWSTDYPPGLSEPNSIRVMENVMITREGAARVRPGLRSFMSTKMAQPIVGSHELFFANDGTKSYLVAVRESSGRLTFRVINFPVDEFGRERPTVLTLTQAGFEINDDVGNIGFGPSTTYVRYLQIDNVVFALSNRDEPIVRFNVGDNKSAKRLSMVVRPLWQDEDKSKVFLPPKAWIDANAVSSTAVNEMPNPSFETGWRGWYANTLQTELEQGAVVDPNGYRYSLWMRSKASRTNYCPFPLHDVALNQTDGWVEGPGATILNALGDAVELRIDQAAAEGYMMSELPFQVPLNKPLVVAFDVTNSSNIEKVLVSVRYSRQNGDWVNLIERLSLADDTANPGRKVSQEFYLPEQASNLTVMIGGEPRAATLDSILYVKNVLVADPAEGTSRLDGAMGDGYSWAPSGASVYHPDTQTSVISDLIPQLPGDVRLSVYTGMVVPGSQVATVWLHAYNARGNILGTSSSAALPSTTGTTTISRNLPGGTAYVRVEVRSVQARDESLSIDSVLLVRGTTAHAYFDGNTVGTATIRHRWSGAENGSSSLKETYAGAATIPTALTPIAGTLVSSDAAKNVHNVGFFYTVANEIGESPPSRPTVVKVQRAWTSWLWNLPAANGDPTGAVTDKDYLVADQLVQVLPRHVYDAAIASGATHWNAYFYTWGPNDVAPVTAVKYAQVPITALYEVCGWARLTPRQRRLGTNSPLVPTSAEAFNSTDPSRGSQGMVASDRMVLVGDPSDPARVSWTAAQAGFYSSFSPQMGGGSKQLTSGNISITGCVKLWQNPQSVDTLIILNQEFDGRSDSYFMAPAQITSLSESISIMGFEQTTNTEGTSSPYGCEVFNNALYHPLSHGLVKSTANNYNITHKKLTDDIANMWRSLQYLNRIVSSVHDGRIYYLVYNRLGKPLEQNCRGNEVWVLDVGAETPSWSRWLVQGVSLRVCEFEGETYVSIVKPEGIFVFDPARADDEVFYGSVPHAVRQPIPWYLETNTQGANRAHDAWAMVQQANVVLGTFWGELQYGIRGKDVNGMNIDISKTVLSSPFEKERALPFGPVQPNDREDYLLIQRLMKEWVFYAGSAERDGEVAYSAGQVNFVQYRYAPATVNVGYEYGSVETFEYGGRAEQESAYDSGVPKPYIPLPTFT